MKNLLHKQIKKSIRQDRKNKLTQDLELDSRSGPAERWSKLKQLRSKYTPCPPFVKSDNGTLLPSNQRAEALASYLSTQVWSLPDPTTGSLPPPDFPPINLPLTQISIGDLTIAISRFKTNRSPGTDGIQSELIIYSPLSFRLHLVDLLRHCFNSCQVPSLWKHSRVAMLPKPSTKDPLDSSSFRPISLTQTMYKLYASILRSKLQTFVEPNMRKLQYGFRPARSTSQPIMILRRLIENI